MRIQEVIDHLPPRQDMVRLVRYLASLRRPARGQLLMYGFAGVLVGAGLALLFAPERGTELRSRISERLDEYLREADDVAHNGHDRAEGV